MNSKQPLKVGFIGGSINSAIGNVHRIAIAMDQRFSLVSGCFSRDLGVNTQTGSDWGISKERLYPNFETMLDGEAGKIDALIVLTPIKFHFQMIDQALKNGFDVISEKPLCATPAEVQNLVDSQNEGKRSVLVTFNYTGYPMVRELKQRVKRGDFGKIHSVRLTMQQEGFLRTNVDGTPIKPQSWRLEDESIPTVSLDLGAHVLHLLHFVLGVWPKRVFSRMTSNGSFPSVIDDVDLLAELEDGSQASGWWSKCALGHSNGLSIQIFGTEGSAYWLQADPESLILSDTGGHTVQIHRGSRDCLVAQQPRYNRFKMGHPSGFIEAFSNLYSDIADSVDEKKLNQFVFDANNSLVVLKILEQASISASEKKWREI